MSSFEEFERCLQDALAHLYDPAYRPPELLWAVMGCDPRQGAEAIQTALVREIEALKPASNVPPTARIRRIYGLLSCRYVQGFTQETTAKRLGITARHLRREQPEAAHVLALRLWERSRAEASLVEDLAQKEGMQPPRAKPSGAKPAAWRSHVREELASLLESAPGVVANVGETIDGTVEIASTLTRRHGVSLDVGLMQPNLVAAIHPSALRQILISVIGQLAQHMSSGQVTICAERQERVDNAQPKVRITLSGHPVEAHGPLNDSLVLEMLATQGGSVEIGIDGDLVSFWVELPSVDKAVLVVDDNADAAHLYRRYTVGTRYHIVHVAQGQGVFEIIGASAPDVIVLDVMLPDIDGWELLAHLHEHPDTRFIPVIVCSVIRERDLAWALGAAHYLAKPVQRQQFIQALDQVLSQAARGEPISPANNVVSC